MKTRRILRAGRMAAAAKPIYAAQAGTDYSIASLLINCPIERDNRIRGLRIILRKKAGLLLSTSVRLNC